MPRQTHARYHSYQCPWSWSPTWSSSPPVTFVKPLECLCVAKNTDEGKTWRKTKCDCFSCLMSFSMKTMFVLCYLIKCWAEILLFLFLLSTHVQLFIHVWAWASHALLKELLFPRHTWYRLCSYKTATIFTWAIKSLIHSLTIARGADGLLAWGSGWGSGVQLFCLHPSTGGNTVPKNPFKHTLPMSMSILSVIGRKTGAQI